MPYLRASASMPFVSKISVINGVPYLDGGIADSIPVRAFQHLGYDKCVVVQTRARGYKKSKNKLSFLAGLVYRHYPKFAQAIKERHLMYNKELADIEQMENKGEIIVIRPSKNIKIKHMEKNLNVLQDVYQLGRNDALCSISKIQEFLK